MPVGLATDSGFRRLGVWVSIPNPLPCSFVPETPHPFDHHMRQPYAKIRLAKAALLFALDEWPDIDVPRYLARLDRLAKEVNAERTYNPRDEWEAMRKVLVDRHAFTGNEEDLQNPDNGYLNRVLDTGRGMPIILVVIWLDIADQLDWPLVGIGMPGHFLLRHEGMDADEFIDPFHGGVLRTRRECLKMVRQIVGPGAERVENVLDPVDKRQIVRRMLGNLYSCYVHTADWRRSADVLTHMIAVSPDDVYARAELARVLTNGGRLTDAGKVIEEARKRVFFDPDKALIEERANELKRRITGLN